MESLRRFHADTFERLSTLTRAMDIEFAMRRGRFGVLTAGLLLSMSTGVVHAGELDLTVGAHATMDPGMALVSSDASITSGAVHYSQTLRGREAFSWQLGYEYLGADNGERGNSYVEEYDYCGQTEYDYCEGGSRIASRLRVHGVSGGLRWEGRRSSWLRPYASVGAMAMLGMISMTDDSTGWSEPDPTDWENTTLYELTGMTDLGVAAGVRGAAGATIWLNAPVRPRAKPASVGTEGTANAEAAATGAASPAGSTPSSSDAAAAPMPKMLIGMSLELSGSLMTPILFSNTGTLNVSGAGVNGALVVKF